MQTFMPEPSFIASAASLDYRRLGKQRVEVKQLLLALGVPVGQHVANPAWGKHPAARMWRGHEAALARYGIRVCEAWLARGYADTLLTQFAALRFRGPYTVPPWMGWAEFHRSHQSSLIRKDARYAEIWPGVPADLPYVWPEAG